MSTHRRQYTFANNKIKRVKKKNTSTKKKINTKMFSSSLTGLSFSLTDDWYLSSEASVKEEVDKLSGERSEYLKSLIKKSKLSSFEVLYNEKFVPDVITKYAKKFQYY